jgi:hypothetical protein
VNPAEQAAHAYCSVLFADLDESLDRHQVTILTLPGAGVRWLRAGDPAAIASAVIEADARPGVHAVYLSMGLAHPDAAHTKPDGAMRRAGAADIAALPGLWADLDIAGPAHTKKDLPPTEADALRILESSGLRPTMVWRSGHGLQAFWRFAEPMILDDESDRRRAQQLARNWSTTVAVHAHRLGRWVVDPVFDLARVLRPAGSVNRKIAGDFRRVEILWNDGPDYDPSDIVEHTAEQGYLDRFEGMSQRAADGKGAGSLDLVAIWTSVNSEDYKARGYLPEWMEAALDSGDLDERDKLVHVFRHGHESQDDSATDASLARLCAMVDLDERDAVEMIMCWRLTHRRKLDKVDPRQRKSYLIGTVDKAFASEARKRALGNAGAAALAEQDAAAHRAAVPAAPMADPIERAATAESGARGLGGATVAALGQGTELVEPDHDRDEPVDEHEAPERVRDTPDHEHAPTGPSRPEQPQPEHPAAALPAGRPEPEPDPRDELDDGGLPEDEPYDPVAAASREQADPPEPEPEAPIPGAVPIPEPEPAPAVGSGPASGAGESTSESDSDSRTHSGGSGATRPITGAARSNWGTRTESQAKELDALSSTLLGKASAAVSIWRCQYRGRGAKQERRLVLRIDPGYRWPGPMPEGYVPGLPLTSGWYPAGAFDKLGGWVRALRQDCLMVTVPVKADDFTARFGDTLVRTWEPDTSGGSLANVTREGMLSYLIDFPPMTSWTEAAAQGMPLIIQDEPRWTLDSRFTVLTRWSDFGRHVRTHFAVNVTPPILAEMAELAGAQVAQTRTQTGRWRVVRTDYLSEDEWRLILHGAMVADQQRAERHGMHVVGEDGPVGRDVGLGGPHRAAPGAGA